METNQEVINVDEAQQNAALGQFLAMLGEDNMPYGFQNGKFGLTKNKICLVSCPLPF